ncbi:MAG: DUF1489 family protein [Caulobacterales bacterium]
MALHMIKLCVGCDTVDELLAWRAEQGSPSPWILRTRQTPKRAAELIEGGSLYRVYKGFVLSRQRILDVATVGQGVATRCEITLDPEVVLTLPTPRRAFQGWRYLDGADAPADLAQGGGGEAMPTELARQLREIGAW